MRWNFFRRWSSQTSQSGLVRPVKLDELAQYNTYDARTLFSDLLRRVRAGEQIVIAHAGTPIAKLVPFGGTNPRHSGVIRAHLVIDRRPDEPGWSPRALP